MWLKILTKKNNQDGKMRAIWPFQASNGIG